MKRTLLSTLVITSTLGLSTSVLALGMGELKLQSSLNEPLQAEIQLTNVKGLTEWEIKPSLASEKDFDRAGVEKTFFLSDIDFTVDGENILLSSNKSVTEPFLNLLVQVNWPTGRVLREYTLLLDPPKTNSTAAPLVTSGAYQTSPKAQSTTSKASKKQQDLVLRTTKPAVTSKWDSEPAKSGTYKVEINDTLWQIALRTRPNQSISAEQMMLAIQDANPSAFINGDASRLKSHQVLKIPNENQILSRTAQQAQNEFSANVSSFEKSATPKGAQLDATKNANSKNKSESGKKGGELKLLVKEGNETQSTDASGDVERVDSGLKSSNVQDELAIALESLDTSKLENEDLKKHLASLEEQVATLQRLVALQNDQLATLQGADFESDELGDDLSERSLEETAIQDDQITPDASTTLDAVDAIDTADNVGSLIDQDSLSVENSSEDDFDLENEAAAAIASFTDIDSDGDQADAENGSPVIDTADTNENDNEELSNPSLSSQQSPNTAEADMSNSEESQSVNTEVVNSDSNNTTTNNTVLDHQAVAKNQPQGLMATVMAKPEIYGGIIAGLVLLLSLLLLALRRRRDAKEDEAPEVIEDIDFPEMPSEEVVPEEEDTEQPEEVVDIPDLLEQSDDVLEEAEIYIAYGRYDQAAKLLEDGIQKEPGRTALHVKLLEIYAETDNAAGFAKTENALNELYDRDASDKALILKNRLTAPVAVSTVIAGAAGAATVLSDDENEVPLLDVEDLADSNTDFVDDLDFEAALDLSEESDDESSLMDELDLAAASDFDSDSSFQSKLDSAQDSNLDLESDFDLSSEFDKDNDSGSDDEGFDDLLALSASDEAETAALDLQNEAEETVTREDLSLLETEFDLEDLDDTTEKANIKSEIDLAIEPVEIPTIENEALDSIEVDTELEEFSAISEADLESLSESDDEFDFLAGADECATKLDLARAYLDMEDSDGAKDLLKEVIASGSEEQKQEAQSIIDEMK